MNNAIRKMHRTKRLRERRGIFGKGGTGELEFDSLMPLRTKEIIARESKMREMLRGITTITIRYFLFFPYPFFSAVYMQLVTLHRTIVDFLLFTASCIFKFGGQNLVRGVGTLLL